MAFRSTERVADVEWTDTQTGTQHTTEVYVYPGNGGSFEKNAPSVIAAAKLNGFRDVDRVQIDSINPRN